MTVSELTTVNAPTSPGGAEPAAAAAARVGAVAIGRNEGDLLRQCLASLQAARLAAGPVTVVYVDSGSTDGSVALARSMGVEVVELDLSTPFTAARARNAGLDRLLQVDPTVELVQFVDGDCEVVAGWLERAVRELQSDPKRAVVCGRRRERFPDASVYNKLCDFEWNTPVGPARACGGDALMRVAAVRGVGGYNPAVIAGEEPEMCARLRHAGWTIQRVDAEMTLHDARVTRFRQWARRMRRGGHAYAEGSARHGGMGVERMWVRQSASIWMWAVAFPLAVVLASVLLTPWCLLALLVYPLLVAKIARHRVGRGDTLAGATSFAFFCVVAKWPQVAGQCEYWGNRARGKRAKIVEYKGPAVTPAA